MALFSSTQISWSEPWFFLIRIRTAVGWMPRVATAFVVVAVMFLSTYFFDDGRFGLVEAGLLSLACGLATLLLLDKGNLQREVSVQKDSISISSAMGRTWHSIFKLQDIESVELMRAEEWNYSVNGMLIDHGDDDFFLVAIPHKVSLETLANILYRMDLAISLSDWSPPDGDSRHQVKDEIPLEAERAVGNIDNESLADVEKALLSPVQIAMQLSIALGPLLLALIAAVIAGVYLFRNWADVPLLNRCVIGGGAFAGLAVSFLYMIKIGQFISAAYGIRMAKASLQRRGTSMFSGLEEDLVTVELFSRDKWTSMAITENDFGFLQIGRQQRRLRFEGNKNRWTLPFGALTTCRIEESIVGSEGDENAERRYYVVLAAQHEEDEEWEYGFIYTRTEIGNDSHERRHDRAKLLFTQLADAIGN
ncbi:MAG: hypothetical protein ABGZ23_08150 [Fuerstiella sp.]|nr:hypothetical protein [Fuerstiella sp.]